MSCPEVFQRVEKKYRIQADQRRQLEELIAEHLAFDERGATQVTSLYFDTPERSLIARSLEKPLYKEKLRLRAYGAQASEAMMEALCHGGMRGAGRAGLAGDTCDVAADEMFFAPVFFELKKKYKGIVYKRRTVMSVAAAHAYAQGSAYEAACTRFPLRDPALVEESLSARSVQIAREIDAMFQRHAPLGPSIATVCTRTAWLSGVGAESCAGVHVDELDDLRITFDGDLRFCDCASAREGRGVCEGRGTCEDWGMREGQGTYEGRGACEDRDAWQPIIGASESVMEIKCAASMPLWLVEALAQVRAYPSSFSKYGTAYQIAGGSLAGGSRPAYAKDAQSFPAHVPAAPSEQVSWEQGTSAARRARHARHSKRAARRGAQGAHACASSHTLKGDRCA